MKSRNFLLISMALPFISVELIACSSVNRDDSSFYQITALEVKDASDKQFASRVEVKMRNELKRWGAPISTISVADLKLSQFYGPSFISCNITHPSKDTVVMKCDLYKHMVGKQVSAIRGVDMSMYLDATRPPEWILAYRMAASLKKRCNEFAQAHDLN